MPATNKVDKLLLHQLQIIIKLQLKGGSSITGGSLRAKSTGGGYIGRLQPVRFFISRKANSSFATI